MKFLYIEPELIFESEIEHKLLEKEAAIRPCDYTNHHCLQPFFLDNYRLFEYYNMQTNDNEAAQLLIKLKGVEDRIKMGETVKDSGFNHPPGLANNWDEDYWTKRLDVGIQKTFKVDTRCCAGQINFSEEVLSFLKVRSFLNT